MFGSPNLEFAAPAQVLRISSPACQAGTTEQLRLRSRHITARLVSALADTQTADIQLKSLIGSHLKPQKESANDHWRRSAHRCPSDLVETPRLYLLDLASGYLPRDVSAPIDLNHVRVLTSISLICSESFPPFEVHERNLPGKQTAIPSRRSDTAPAGGLDLGCRPQAANREWQLRRCSILIQEEWDR